MSLLFWGATIAQQTNNDLDAPIIGIWEGTITQTGGASKSFKLIVQEASFNSETNVGIMKGYSTVNGGNKTDFYGNWEMQGNMWPKMELKEPVGKPFNGIISLSDCNNFNYKKYESWEAICGSWVSYNKKITSRIYLKKISDRTK
jgi:hypothetical protein